MHIVCTKGAIAEQLKEREESPYLFSKSMTTISLLRPIEVYVVIFEGHNSEEVISTMPGVSSEPDQYAPLNNWPCVDAITCWYETPLALQFDARLLSFKQRFVVRHPKVESKAAKTDRVGVFKIVIVRYTIDLICFTPCPGCVTD